MHFIAFISLSSEASFIGKHEIGTPEASSPCQDTSKATKEGIPIGGSECLAWVKTRETRVKKEIKLPFEENTQNYNIDVMQHYL